MVDEEGDEFTMSVDIGATGSFLVYDNFVFTVLEGATTESQVADYTIKISVVDVIGSKNTDEITL